MPEQSVERKQDLAELGAELGASLAWLARATGISYWRLYDGPISKGSVTLEEIDQLTAALRCERSRVEDALRENARRHEAAKAAPTSSSGGKSA